MNKNYNNLTIGKLVENAAANYLLSNGLEILEKNFSCKLGEIDLIALDQENQQLVFVEVRYRKSSLFGTAIDSVNQRKQQKIINSANYYLIKKFGELAINYRFDIVTANGDINNLNFEWFIGAFNRDDY